jgi:ankyrin repeat protein
MVKKTLLKTLSGAVGLLVLAVTLNAAPYDDMMEGCKKGDVEKVRAAVAAGVDVNKLDASGNTALAGAIFWPDIVTVLLGAGANPNAGSLTPLYNAAGNGCTETVKLLLGKGADPNNKGGASPLSYSILMTNNAVVAKLLIDAGAKTDIKGGAGENLIYVWADSKNYQDKIDGLKGIATLLEGNAYGYKMPDWYKNQDTSLNQNPEDVLKLLLAKNVNINEMATGSVIQGWTPLLATFRFDKPDKARMLIANGADVKTPIKITMPKLTYQPICLAAERGKLEIVKLMAEKGADLNVQAENSALIGNSGFIGCKGLTPLNIALMFGNYEAAEYLVDKGADLTVGVSGQVFLPVRIFGAKSDPVLHNIKDKSAIFYAIESGNIALVNKVGEKLGWKAPDKFTVDAVSTVVTSFDASTRYNVTFKKQKYNPSDWADKIGMKEIYNILKAKKM